MTRDPFFCADHHQRRGIVTTHPDGYPKDSREGHFSATCCGAADCVRELAGEAYKIAGILGIFRPDLPRLSADQEGGQK